MEKKSIKKNYIYNLVYQIFLLLTPFITTPYISRVIGADGIGTVSYAESVVSYFVLFATLGITTYGQREISYVQDSIEKRSELFWNTKILEILSSTIVLITYLIFVGFQNNNDIFLILSFNIVAVFVDITWLLQGLEEFGKIVVRNLILRIFSIIFIFMFVKTSNDVFLYAFGLAFFPFIGNLSLWLYLPKYIKRISIKRIRPFRNIRTILSLFVPTIAVQVYTVLDKTMIGVITNNSFENGYYEQASKICKMVLTLVTALGTVMIPRIGYYFNNNRQDEVKNLMYRSYRFVLFLGIPLTCGLIGISSTFVPWFFGNGFDKVSILIPILSLLIIAIGVSSVTGMQYLIPTKRQNILSISVLLGALINFSLNMVLIRIYASVGAAIASIVAEMLVTISQLYFVRKELSIFRIFVQGKNYYIAGITMLCAIKLISVNISSCLFNTIFLIFLGVFWYFSMLIVLKDDFFLYYINIFTRKIRKE